MTAQLGTAQLLKKIAIPVVRVVLEHRLRRAMPIEAQFSALEERKQFSHLEAVGRLLCGLAPLLELNANVADSDAEDITSASVRQVLDAVTDPDSPDYLNYSVGTQPLVDTAFLAQGLLRAPNALWGALDDRVKRNLCSALDSSRAIRPHFNNWLLFSATIEAFLFKAGERWDKMRIDYGRGLGDVV